ncbi:hypothetical protein [Eubacterium ventriosum]|jgi:hypothetical protein|uniref:hypothetical protein n=1 Tax=Eubacterium ventriosum TaxID=39496 RepID=UPI003522EE63
MSETKREKFIRLAENRTQSVIKGIELLGNLSNPNAYEYTNEDLDKVVNALKKEVGNLEKIYSLAKDRTNKKFKL